MLTEVGLFLKQVDTYGTQQPIALLKLLLEKGGMFDRGKELTFKYYRDMGFLAAMGKVSHLTSYTSKTCKFLMQDTNKIYLLYFLTC